MTDAAFLVSSLQQNDKVSSAAAVDPHIVEAQSVEGAHWTFAAFDQELYEKGDLESLLASQSKIDCVVLNRNRDRFSGGALEIAAGQGIGMLHHRALHAVIHQSQTFYDYLDRLTKTVLEDFSKHPNVGRVYRADSFRLGIERAQSPAIHVVPMDSYIATAAEVREKLSGGTDFKFLVNLNPNGEDSTSAFSAAEEAGVRLVTYNQLWGLLYK